MRTQLSKITLAATLGLALALTFSCSSGSDDDGGGGSGGSPGVSSSSVGGGSVPTSDKGNSISSYRTKRIGNQTWMAENLNYKVAGSKCYGEGSEVKVDGNWIALSIAEIQANCDKYGRLYDWATAMALPSSCNSTSCSSQVLPKHRGICPSGWHIPSDEEWRTLTNYVGGAYNGAGTKLKATSGWDYNGSSGNGTDEFGFSALPGGFGYSDGNFNFVGYGGNWWSATEDDASYAWDLGMYFSYADVHRDFDAKTALFSVRCVQD